MEKSEPEKKGKKQPTRTSWVKGIPSPNPSGRPVGALGKKAKAQEALIAKLELDSSSPDSFINQYLEVFKKSAIENPEGVASKVISDMLFTKGLLEDLDKQMNKTMSQHRAFQRFRVYELAFAKQRLVLDSRVRNKAIMAGRRSGKTEVACFEALYVQADKPGARVLIIGLTILKTVDIFQGKITKYLDELGHAFGIDNEIHQIKLAEGGGVIQFGGNANKAEREKYLGQFWDLIITDESQSQPSMQYFIESVLKPMLIDTRGTLMLIGTGPRVPGTYWESFYNDNKPGNFRINWNAGDNEILREKYEGQDVLAAIREELHYDEESALYKREILGLPIYDTEALVFPMTESDIFDDDEFRAWMAKQNPANIRFTAGLDWGFTDAAAFVIVCYSGTSNIRWVIHEYKAYGQSVSELADAVRIGIDYVTTNPLFDGITYRVFNIYADDSAPEKIKEFRQQYNFTIVPARRSDRDALVASVKRDSKRHWIKTRRDSPLYDESQRTVFKRSEHEGMPLHFVTGELDDDIYHPDVMFAYGYGIRDEIWTQFGDGGVFESDAEFVPDPDATLSEISRDKFESGQQITI